jgi:hypothetical protein
MVESLLFRYLCFLV